MLGGFAEGGVGFFRGAGATIGQADPQQHQRATKDLECGERLGKENRGEEGSGGPWESRVTEVTVAGRWPRA